MENSLNIFNKHKELIYLLFLLVGNLVVSSLASFFRIDSQFFAVPYRFVVFFFSIYLLINNEFSKKWKSKAILIFCAFWFIYFLKIVYSFHNYFYLPEFVIQENKIYLIILDLLG